MPDPTEPPALEARCEDLQAQLAAVDERLDRTHEELSLLHRLSRTLRVEQAPEAVLRGACEDLVAAAGFRFAAVFLGRGPDRGSLAGVSVWAAAPGLRLAGGLRAQILAAGEELRERPPASVPGSILEPVDPGERPALAALAGGVVVAPLGAPGAPGMSGFRGAGWLVAAPAGGGPGGRLLTSAEAKLAESVAGPLGVFLENRLLFEEADALAGGVLVSLVRAIDAKDPATRGHSERVARLAAQLGAWLNLPAGECRRLRLAGLVHDLGKIGVPESVLLKEGPLDDAEYAKIKEHPERGVEILRGLAPLADLLPAVLHHHERWDGRGYPAGLTGDATPLHARIVGLADAFDAITSRRSYRAASSVAACLTEIERSAGTHFDPDLAAAFVRMKRSEAAAAAPQPRRLAA